MQAYAEQSFGPVKPIVRVDGEEEAIRVANNTEYGVSAAVFSCDEAQMRFGGVKGLGYGRFGGKAAIAEFTDLRRVTVENSNQHCPF